MSDIDEKLKALVAAYPLPEPWLSPEVFAERLELGSLVLPLAGLTTRSCAGLEVTGSAAGDDHAAERCFFELVERVAIVEAQSSHPALFPESPAPERWRYARSNGVAAHPDRERAGEAAFLELIERDRLLRSWYGEIVPRRAQLTGLELAPEILERYELEAYLFERSSPNEPAIEVAGLFGFPKSRELPRISGFGARHDRSHALAAAARECLQGFGFLYGEAIPEELPELAPHPLYHQERYLHRDGIAIVRAWLAGDHRRFARRPPPRNRGQPKLVDLTPEGLRGRVHVVKANGPAELPLAFGEVPPPEWSELPRELWVHPIS